MERPLCPICKTSNHICVDVDPKQNTVYGCKRCQFYPIPELDRSGYFKSLDGPREVREAIRYFCELFNHWQHESISAP